MQIVSISVQRGEWRDCKAAVSWRDGDEGGLIMAGMRQGVQQNVCWAICAPRQVAHYKMYDSAYSWQ